MARKFDENLAISRKKEIVAACAELYETMSFRDITIKEIAEFTSFTRPSIYNYFQTKEEIFLALFEQEYKLWVADLRELNGIDGALSKVEFAERLARTLEKRERLLRLLSMNMYDMEQNSRLENLVEFKKAYGASLDEVRNCLEHFFPDMSVDEVQDFLFAFFPLMFGIYPYAVVTDKQREAMTKAGAKYRYLSIYDLALNGIKRLLGIINNQGRSVMN